MESLAPPKFGGTVMHDLTQVWSSRLRVLFIYLLVQAYTVSVPNDFAFAAEPNPKDWSGFGWGLGIAANFDTGGKRVA